MLKVGALREAENKIKWRERVARSVAPQRSPVQRVVQCLYSRHYKWTTREKTLDIVNIPQNPENKPRGLHFSKALFEGLVFGGVYLWREICVSKSIWLALWLEGNLPFLLCFTFYFEGNFQVQTPGGLIFGGAI